MRKSKANTALFSFAGALALAVAITPAAIGKASSGSPDTISPSGSSGFKFVAQADAYVTSAKPK